ncbi:MAG: heme-binding protein, partial [Chloroflexota bacterium]
SRATGPVAAGPSPRCGRPEHAANKAYTALVLKVPTHEGRRRDDRAQESQPEDYDAARWLRVGGGYPLAEGIDIYGAVGVAGCETPQQDVLCCQAALASLRFGGQ